MDKIRAKYMPLTINIDRFTRLNQSIVGKFAPYDLPGLMEYLAGEDGEIHYSMAGNLAVDPTGSGERQVKCIICGWILLSDPVTLAPVRHQLDIRSSLILVRDESALPPLEMESASEDYIICSTNMLVAERVEEEILLSLPVQAANRRGMIGSSEASAAGGRGKPPNKVKAPTAPVAETKKISPFAKLAELKKK